ncbi:MAG: hypothetical protein CGW95_11610 [Phenylobacterium zucineum]|nr:MAG: hypothetical protein CGW95_11610 [Phenylobacterium zucineum]
MSADARGAGNSIVATDLGGNLKLTSNQINDGGGVDVVANITAGDGNTVYAGSDAVGNSIRSYTCANCTGPMISTNNQANAGSISASTTATITGTVASVTGVANATGNSAIYYVRKPGLN